MNITKAIAWLVLGLTLLASGTYIFRYMYVWEWHRAILVTGLFLAAEIAFVTALILRAIRTRGESAPQRRSAPDPLVLARLHAAAPQRDHFAWLSPRQGQLNVFITMLLGGGVVVSGLAWVVERLASNTATRGLERNLAGRLSAIALPKSGLIAGDEELLAQAGPYADDEELRLLLGPTADTR